MDIDAIKRFNKEIEDIVSIKKVSYMDAIIDYCERKGLELELVNKLISSTMKAKLQTEAEDLHFIRRSKTKQLPI